MNENPPQDNQPPQEPQQPFNEPPQQPYPQQQYPQQPYPQWQPPQQQPPTQYPPNYQPNYQPTYPPYAPPPPPPPVKKKSSPLLWILVVLGIVLVIVVCSAAMSAALHSTPSATIQATATPDIAATNVANAQATQNAATPLVDTTTTPPPTPNPSQSDTYPNGDYKVGKTAQVSSWSMTVNSAKTSYGGPYDSLKPGNIFLVVDVTVKNGTGSSQNVSSALNFKLNDSTGQGYNETIITGAKPPDDTALRDGAKLRGQLVYEVPKSMKHFTFTYQPDISASDQATWDINL